MPFYNNIYKEQIMKGTKLEMNIIIWNTKYELKIIKILKIKNEKKNENN